MFGQNFNMPDLNSKFGMTSQPPSQPRSGFGANSPQIPNPLTANTPQTRGRDDTASSTHNMQDFRMNFNIDSMSAPRQGNFKDALSNPMPFGGGFGGSSGFGGQSGFGGGFGNYGGGFGSNTGGFGAPSSNLGGQYGLNKPSQPSPYGYQPTSAVPQTNQNVYFANKNTKMADQFVAPPPQKPTPSFDTNQHKQIENIMKQHSDVDKGDMMDKAHLGKVIYSAALSSSSTSQKYDKLLADLKRTNSKFTDSDFPPEKSSLATPDKLGSYRDIAAWKRASEIFKKPALYEGAIEPNDILQGNMGDCYLLSTLAAIAENPDRIRSIFLTQNYNEQGIYALQIVWRGANREVILDDYLPVDKRNEPYFLKSKNNELWVVLLEKAWAKLHRNYDRLDGQLTKETLHDFTGAPVRSYRTNKDQQQLWQKMVDADKRNYIMTTGTEGEDVGAGDPLRKFGLVSGHAYTLIGANEVKLNNGQTVQLVQVRNPWGEFEWSGRWSDKDSLWNNVPQNEKTRIGYTIEDDGTFFLEYRDMLEYFDGVQICYYQDGFFYQGKEFRSASTESKYFEIKIPKTGNYYFNISQISIRIFDEDYQDNPNQHYSDTKFCIADQSGKVVQGFYGKKRDLYSCKYIDNPFQFQAGTYQVFVRVNWQKGATHSFGLGAYGPAKIEIKEINKSQAGNLSNACAPWEQNRYPQFEIEQIAVI